MLRSADETFGFAKATPVWSGKVASHSEGMIVADAPRPTDWQPAPEGVQQYVVVRTADHQTGLPVSFTEGDKIEIERFPVPAVTEFDLPNLVVIQK
jgi:hypothetical protein